jgi:hypothetical protein
MARRRRFHHSTTPVTRSQTEGATTGELASSKPGTSEPVEFVVIKYVTFGQPLLSI